MNLRILFLGLSFLLVAAAPADALKRRAHPRAPSKTAQTSGTAPPVLATVAVAVATPRVTSDRELSHKYLDKGLSLLAAGDYAAALVEFDLASGFQSTPALDYNMARCHEHLDHVEEAVAAYERFLHAAPDDPQSNDARDHLTTLRRQLATSAQH